ncbi:MAG: HD domain-containing protein [Clostridiales bacterium]|nr:HD domain-containing protein [Clostridiales bacterium]
MSKYHSLSGEIIEKIKEDRENHVVNPYAFIDDNITRRNSDHDHANIWRPAFVRDIEKIMHIPYYNRYSDKTQVFSFYKNDDISRRALHVQFVSRIARNIGSILNLNCDLIEAIALGHDIGHTPFGHAGERMISEIYRQETGRYFNHNVHSVRVLDKIIHRNISLETLDGILCHNGELEQKEYRPRPIGGFDKFDEMVESCYIDEENIGGLVPSTLEGCVVRICDIIAYLGKDRQDAMKLGIVNENSAFSKAMIGTSNAEIINNLVVNIIENSYGKPYLMLDDDRFNELKMAKRENYKLIYGNPEMEKIYSSQIRPMLHEVYYKLLDDAKRHNKNSYLYTHHIAYVNENNKYSIKSGDIPYEEGDANDLVIDYIASMTDDYFIDLYHQLFPSGKYDVCYKGYFE